MFDLVKSWQASSPEIWNTTMMKTAVSIQWITADEFKALTGQEYTE